MNQPHDASPAGESAHSGRYAVQPNGRTPPLSPHMQIWRWHITMLASITFRATIIAATAGTLFGLGWLAAAGFGPDAYARFLFLAGSPLGLFIGFGLTVVLFSLLLNGGRHLLNDFTVGLDVKTANLMSYIAVWGPVVVALLFWVALFATGRVSL